MDACFRLQNRSCSSEAKDPTLGPGWAFFVDDRPYHEHLKNYIHKDEVCSDLLTLRRIAHAAPSRLVAARASPLYFWPI